MNANKNGRLNQAHEIPTFTVAPVTRAVRAALAISLTLLALGGSSAALATGTGVPAASATTSWDGAFNVSAGHIDFAPIDDLAVVQDHLVPHSVTPAAGLMGVDAHWGGNASATHADITTLGADELFAHSPAVAATSSTITHAPMSRTQSLGTAAYGDVSYINNGPINAYAAGAYDVTAVYSNSAVGSDTVDNQSAGTINAVAQDGNAIAVNASGYVNATVTNEGAITSSSVNGVAVGVIAQGYTGTASVTNSGSITATSTNYQAVGILASSADGYASVTNSGSVTATGGQDQAIGIEAFGQTGSSVYNTGSVTATSATGTAIGILAQTVNGNASVTNTYNITAGSGYNAVGLSAISANGDASASSSGHVQAIGQAGLTSGIEAYATVGNANASNSGYVDSGTSHGSAVGVSAVSGDGSATASNASSGYVRVVAVKGDDASGYATGISAKTYNGDATASNDGKLFIYSRLGVTIGINVSAAGGNATATNTGLIETSNYLFNNVRGIQAISSTGNATVTNSSEILASSNAVLGYPFSFTTVDGIGAQGYTGSTVTNTGYINASGPWFVNGVEGISVDGTATVTNTSTAKIVATGLVATGLSVSADYGQGQAVVNNAGSIIVNQEGDCHCSGITPYGTGIYAFSDFASGVQVTNSGSISVNTQHGAWGINAITFNDVASVTNTGSIAVATTGYNAVNFGISATSAYGTTSVVNSGDITITTGVIPNVYHPENNVTGIFAETGRHHDAGYGAGYYGAGDTSVTNTGNINFINAVEGFGIHAVAEYGSALVSNSGHITLNDSLVGWGIFANTYSVSGTAGVGDVIDNAGTITVTGPVDARGIEALSSGTTAGASITNTGDIALSATGDDAYGVFVRNYAYGTNTSNLTVNNGGTISAANVAGSAYVTGTFRGAQADGIRIFGYANNAIVNNTGSITTSESGSFSAGSAIGVLVHNGYGSHFGNTSITNAGSITASILSNNSTSSFHEYYAHGAFAGGAVAAATYGDVAIANTGSITATATGAYNTGAGLTTADGMSVISKVGNSSTRSYNLGDITLTNGANGSIAASAESTEGTGAAVANGIAALESFGSQGGSLVSQGSGISVSNAGLVSATALVDTTASGAASAFGISATNGSPAGFADVRNTGGVYATATSPGVATATGISTTANDITVALGTNSLIVATANGPGSIATGLFASGATLSASNSGTIKAIATGTDGIATGVQLVTPGALSFTNTGAIHANASHAVTVNLTSATTATLINNGLIVARPTVAHTNGIAVETSAPNAVIQNYGTLTGKLRNGAGNFTFTNFAGGIWNAAGISDFGAGNDFFRNVGTIHLNGSTINLGSLGALGSNRFTNASGAAITVVGSNQIAMGAATPNVFMNNGTLNFQNGVVGDALAINGDFGGNGTLALDVSGLHGTADQLQIHGNVLAGTVNRVNLHLLDDPTSASTIIPLITVSGTSVAGSFVLGTVVQDKSFLDVLVSNIDPSNTKSDVFSLGLSAPKSSTPPTSGTSANPASPINGVVSATAFASEQAIGFAEDVNGLSNLGTLAVSAAPGAQSLMNSQIGTLQQRMGAASQTLKGGVSLWARVFGDSGTIDPSHNAGNFGQGGNFSFDQSNTGEELGIDFAFTDELKAGLLVAKDQANQHLDSGNNGSARIKGTTGGGYLTWISATGVYMDASFRAMDFTSRLHASAGEAWVKGNADAFNLETGKTWTLDNGLQIAPQLQYTWNRVNDVKSQSDTLAGFHSGGDASSRGRLGLMVSKSYATANDGTVWTPYVSVSAVHEFDGVNRYSVDDTFFGQTSTRGTSALVDAGVNVKVRNLSFYGGANWLDGGAMKSFLGGQVGLRYSW